MLRGKNAFTLIELMVVIVIIGILAALAIPKFNEASVKAKAAEAPTVLSSYDNAQLAYLAETNNLGEVTRLVIANPENLNSKYYTYTDNASAGSITAAAHASGMGLMGGASLWTVVGTDAAVTHTDDDADVAQYLPNWEHTTL